MNHHQRGQSSFEILLLVAFVVSLSIFVLAQYLDISPSLYGTAVVKSEILRQLTEQGSSTMITSVDYLRDSTGSHFTVTLNPTSCSTSLIDWDRVTVAVQAQSGLENATVSCVTPVTP